jgi:hypothetical protein
MHVGRNAGFQALALDTQGKIIQPHDTDGINSGIYRLVALYVL